MKQWQLSCLAGLQNFKADNIKSMIRNLENRAKEVIARDIQNQDNRTSLVKQEVGNRSQGKQINDNVEINSNAGSLRLDPNVWDASYGEEFSRFD